MGKHKKPRASFVALIIAASLLCTFTTVYSIKDIQYSRYLERAKSLDLVMSKIGNHLNVAFETKWNRVRFLTTRIERISADSVDDLIQVLDDIYVETGADFKVVDDEGIAYYHDGVQEYWKDHRAVPSRAETFILSPLQFGVSNENFMKYIVPLKNPLIIGDTKIMYTVHTEPLSVLHKDFDTSNYGEGCLSFIIDKAGTFIYENGAGDPIADSYNFLAYVEKMFHFQYGESFERLKENIDKGVSHTVFVEYNGKNYYLSHFDLDMENWASIMLVPEENTQAGAKNFTQKLLFNTAVVFGSALILLIIGFLNMWRNTVTRQRVAAEAERRSNEAKTNFLSSMSHDIRTPMNAIIGFTEIALRSKDGISEPVRDNLEKIRLSSQHLLMLVNDILDISKIESGKMSLSIAEFSVVESTNRLANLIRPSAKDKHIDLRIHTYNYRQEYILGDELRFSQVCINLAANAIKYTPSGGSVVIDFRQETIDGMPDKVRLIFVVRDTGIGMSEEYQKVMYDIFSRATDSRLNKVAGSGLGLPICRKMVEMMNGTLECESAPGKGTTFTSSFILDKGREDAVYTLPKMRILVVDHDTVSTDALKRILERLDVEADIINDPTTLPAALEQNHAYQMAFVELGVPGNAGLNTVSVLHEHFGDGFPIVLTDIADMVEYSEQIAEAGVEFIMNKPYFYRTVYETIQRALKAQSRDIGKQSGGSEKIAFRMHVLVAEDNDLNWDIISKLLEMNGIAAQRAEDGKACVDMLYAARPNRYAAVLMDVRMPVLDGLEATRIIRKSKKVWLRTIPIIAMTADAFAEDIQQCLDAGMDEHLAKPINVDRLLAVLTDIHKDTAGNKA